MHRCCRSSISFVLASCASDAEPGVFGFGELLDLPQVQGLVSTDLAAHVSLLRIFAYGIWRDYTSAQEQLPQLTEVQALKLKQLTVASMARGVDSISYDDITRETGISNLRDLEDFLIGCFYSGVIKGTLDHRNLRYVTKRFYSSRL